ncbi:MAG: desulfoferrodoxin [Thermoplasmata archaeon]|nr:MAG: desulfoferrodoxin [Thermoplasmata archaeon]
MTKKLEVYRCEICENIVIVAHEGVGHLVCCGQPMSLLEEKSTDAGIEKHLPVVEINGDEVKVSVGSLPHPMEENHYIEWIEVVTDREVHRKHLKPSDEPKAEFCIKSKPRYVRAYCNVHGLWVKK